MNLTKTFTSPINEDDGNYHRFLGTGRSVVNLTIDREHRSGQIHWAFTMLDGPHKGNSDSIDLRLGFDDAMKRLVYIDGVFEVPDEIITFLEENGINAQYARTFNEMRAAV